MSSNGVKRQKDEIAANMMGKCYGCALYTVGHCLTILRAFATVEESHNWMLSQVVFLSKLPNQVAKYKEI